MVHDGIFKSGGYEEYYAGHDGWAPIMGTGYYQDLAQWSKGEYPGASNTEDDLAIITRTIPYRKDDHGNDRNSATTITVAGSGFTASGIIERNTDVDFFSFTLTQNAVLDINIVPGMRDANLDVLAKLHHSSGTTYHISDPTDSLSAAFAGVQLDAGTWYLSVEGTGKDGVYSDYGSLGSYSIVADMTSSVDTAAPTDFRTTNQTTNSVSLQWTLPQDVQRYVLQYRKAGTTNWITAPAPRGVSTTVSGLLRETTYQFRIKAVNAGVESDWVELEASTKPAAPTVPTNFKVSGKTSDSVTLSWKPSVGTAGYILEYRKSGASTWTAATAPAGTETTITGLEENTTYNFRLKATGEGGESSWASCSGKTDVTAPTAPTNFRATTQTATSVSLEWTASPGAERYVSQYRKAGTTNWIFAPAPKGVTATVNGLIKETAYQFRIKSVKSGVESAWSETEGGTTVAAPTAPTDFKASGKTLDSVTLSWKAPAGVTGYVLEYRKTGASTWTAATAPTGTETTITGLDENTTYNYRIKAIGEGGESAWVSCNARTDVTVPTAPTGFKVVSSHPTSVSLEWTTSPGVERYVLQYRKAGTTNWTTAPAPRGVTTTVNGLVKETTYQFRLKSVKNNAESDWTEVEGATTVAAPTIPTNFKTINQTVNSVTLSWKVPAGATGYVLEYRKSGASTWTTATAPTGTETTITGLDENTTYNFRIKATGEGGESAWVSCNAKTDATAPTAPTGFTVVSSNANSVSLEWTASPGTDRYVLQYRKIGTSNWLTATAPRGTTAKVNGLVKDAAYQFRLKSVKSNVESDWVEIEGRTTVAAPTVATNFKTTGQTVDSVTLSWKAPKDATGYVLEYRKTGSSTWTAVPNLTATEATMTDLEENTTYNFRLKATGDGGESPWVSCSVKTKIAPPAAPTGLSVVSNTSNSASLQWTASAGAERYVLQYRKAGTTNWIFAPAPKGVTAKVNGLLKNTTYQFRLKAVKSGVESDWVETETTAMTAQETDLPVAVILCENATIQEGCGVTLHAETSEDPLEYLWDLDNDGVYETKGASVWFSTAQIQGPPRATYTIHHKVRNEADEESEPVAYEFQIVASRPNIEISAPDATELNTDTRLTWKLLAQTSSYRPIMDWIIDWGDGSDTPEIPGGPRNDVVVSHRFQQPGEYIVTAMTKDVTGFESIIEIGTYIISKTETDILDAEFTATEIVSLIAAIPEPIVSEDVTETIESDTLLSPVVESNNDAPFARTVFRIRTDDTTRQMLDLDQRGDDTANQTLTVVDHVFMTGELFGDDTVNFPNDNNSATGELFANEDFTEFLLTNIRQDLF